MAVTVKPGEIYADVSMGVSAKGRWGKALAKAEKGYDKITIWFSNADDLPDEVYAVAIDEINEVELSHSRSKDGTKWFDNFTCRAKVHAVEGGAVAVDLFESDEGVPF